MRGIRLVVLLLLLSESNTRGLLRPSIKFCINDACTSNYTPQPFITVTALHSSLPPPSSPPPPPSQPSNNDNNNNSTNTNFLSSVRTYLSAPWSATPSLSDTDRSALKTTADAAASKREERERERRRKQRAKEVKKLRARLEKLEREKEADARAGGAGPVVSSSPPSSAPPPQPPSADNPRARLTTLLKNMSGSRPSPPPPSVSPPPPAAPPQNPLSGRATLFAPPPGTWTRLIPKASISPGELVPRNVLGTPLLVVATSDGSVHCVSNSCPHLGTPLDTGRLTRACDVVGGPGEEGGEKRKNEPCITCPLHRSSFSLVDGGEVGEWCPHPPVIGKLAGGMGGRGGLEVLEVRERGKWLEVRLESDVVCVEDD